MREKEKMIYLAVVARRMSSFHHRLSFSLYAPFPLVCPNFSLAVDIKISFILFQSRSSPISSSLAVTDAWYSALAMLHCYAISWSIVVLLFPLLYAIRCSSCFWNNVFTIPRLYASANLRTSSPSSFLSPKLWPPCSCSKPLLSLPT